MSQDGNWSTGDARPEPDTQVNLTEHRHASHLEREIIELRGIVAAMMVKYASGRCVLNPDVLGAVESSLLRIDTSTPGMVVIRYGASAS
jgi:hypothetical protein